MMNLRELGELQLDGLREVANVGAGHAATALSQLTERRIGVEVPRLRIARLADVAPLDASAPAGVAGVLFQVLGDATGRCIQIFPAPTASRIAEILLRRAPVPFPDGFAEMERSALMEVGNIVTGAYLSALSDFLGLLLLASVPRLVVGAAAAVLGSDARPSGSSEDLVLCIDTHFSMEDSDAELDGHFLLLPDPPALRSIFQALRLA